MAEAGEQQSSNPQKIIKLNVPEDEYKRLLKIVKNYEKSRFRSAVYARKKHDDHRATIETKLKEVGLEKMLKKRKTKDEPVVKELKLESFVAE